MAIKPNCDRCGEELSDYGAILFSPPNENSQVKKLHVCQACYGDILQEFPHQSKK